MAEVIKRVWRSGPRKVRRIAWGYTLQVNGKQVRKFDGAWSEDDARQALVAFQEQLQTPAAAARIERTVQQLAEEYLQYKLDRGKRSLKSDRRILATRILPAFGSALPVRQLTAAAVAQYERQRVGEVTAFTVSNELTVLRHMLRLAKRWGYLDEVPEIEMPKKPDGRLRYLEEDEIARLLAACAESKNRDLFAIVTLALNTGMRKGEILGLEWQRVDLAADFGLSARITLYRTKSGKPRGIPLNRAACDALRAVAGPEIPRSGRVFTHRNVGVGEVKTGFANALVRAGIEGFRFHDLRHTFASHFVMRGGKLQSLREILGHADLKMTMRYSHLSPAHLRADIDRLEGLTPAVQHINQHKESPNPASVA